LILLFSNMPLYLICNFVNNLFINLLKFILNFSFILFVGEPWLFEGDWCNNNFHLVFILYIKPRSEFFVIFLNSLSLWPLTSFFNFAFLLYFIICKQKTYLLFLQKPFNLKEITCNILDFGCWKLKICITCCYFWHYF
jgi:hypothetical protein